MHACIVLLCTIVLFHLTLAQFTRFNLSSVDPLALCNDGTSAVYYFRPGFGSGATTWLIAHMGGGWCWDKSTCASRALSTPHLTSSRFCPSYVDDDEPIHNVEHVGILSGNETNNPYFYNANVAWLWYCSSDSHLGNKTSEESLNGWNFQGKRIFSSLVHHLLFVQSPSMLNATDILLSGSSAGAVGALNNADYLQEIIASVLPKVHYGVFVDAGWFLDIPAYTPNFSFELVAKSLFTNWGAIYDESCMSAYGVGNEWHCFHSQYTWLYVTTDAFYQEFQFDSANLAFDGVNYPETNKTSYFFSEFQQNMLNLTTKVPFLFLPNCYQHQTISLPIIYTIKIGNVSIADGLFEWFSQKSETKGEKERGIEGESERKRRKEGKSGPMRWVETCQPINCGVSCPPL